MFAADLPHNIPVDISSLINFSKNIHVRDLKVSDKVQIITPADETVAKVQPPRDVEAELAAVPVDEKAAVEARSPRAKSRKLKAKKAKPKKAKLMKNRSKKKKRKRNKSFLPSPPLRGGAREG